MPPTLNTMSFGSGNLGKAIPSNFARLKKKKPKPKKGYLGKT